MDYLRATLGCSSDVEIYRFLEDAGNYEYAMLDLRNRWGSHSAPLLNSNTGSFRRPLASAH
eukprot:1963810-Lingulodinium_polyedra.AAC.1